MTDYQIEGELVTESGEVFDASQLIAADDILMAIDLFLQSVRQKFEAIESVEEINIRCKVQASESAADSS